MSEEKETKVCKYCKSEIPKKAKVCPNCRNRTFSGQFSHPVVIATRQNNSYCFHFLSPALIITSPPANTPSG